ncbi:MAG: HAD-IB family hydrolase, partial [Treponema sp.]|nr:HAD-IB family hydrolase [Treponema sp.]
MIHIFDVDQTVVKKTSTEYFVRMAMKEKIIRFSQVSRLPMDWIKYKLARPDMDFIENTIKKLSGIKKTDLERVSEMCFEKHIKPSIFSDAARIINEVSKKGEKVIFATSSFDFIIQPLERFFGISGSLACQLEYSDGITTGNLIGQSSFGPKKKLAVQAWMERNSVGVQDTAFYSDSYTDIPLLEYCGKPIAVNPDGILLRHAKKHGWEVMRFR